MHADSSKKMSPSWELGKVLFFLANLASWSMGLCLLYGRNQLLTVAVLNCVRYNGITVLFYAQDE